MLRMNLQRGEAFLCPSWQVNVDRGAHAGAQVGGAGVEVAVPLGYQFKKKEWRRQGGSRIWKPSETYFSETWKSLPDSSLTDFCTALKIKIITMQLTFLHSVCNMSYLIPRASLSKTPFTSPPFCMEMILS